MSLGNYLEAYSFEYLMERALERVPNDIDKRQGSIIYDALAPAVYQMAEMYMEIRNVYLNAFILTAYGEYLDHKVIEQGITRYEATRAIKRGVFTFSGEAVEVIGTRFVALNSDLIYRVIEVCKDESDVVIPNQYMLECESAGSIGNSYTGDLMPLDYINTLTNARLEDVIVAARDIEDDESLRSRFIYSLNNKSYCGNISFYKEKISELTGVGDVQVYPTYNGGGTVLCSVVDSVFNPLSQSVVSEIQEAIDPTQDGQGIGIAPIGHHVTITTPSKLQLRVEANVNLQTGYIVESVKAGVESEINKYLLDLKKQWATGDELNKYKLSIYLARILASILSVDGVENVSDVLLNEVSQDLNLEQSSSVQLIPELIEVVLHVQP